MRPLQRWMRVTLFSALFLLLLLLLFLLLFLHPAKRPSSPTVTTPTPSPTDGKHNSSHGTGQPGPHAVLRNNGATVIGTLLTQSLPKPIEAFLGIPYAVPPIGDRRFRPAAPANVSGSPLMAISYGKRCPGRPLAEIDGWDEDCLNLNVFRPQGDYKGKRAPVAVYIHGGAFNSGSGKWHDTAAMVAGSEEPFVAVNFNYRIGALGFLPSEALATDGFLNLGLRDQILVLEWVKANIGGFGGDPDQITLMGVSAGAHSVGHHLLRYKDASPLFHRVLIESGAPTARAVYPYNASLPRRQYDEFLIEAGCSGLSDTDTMTCLRDKPVAVIVQASLLIFDRYVSSDRWAFQPVIDGEVIEQAPVRAWDSGRWNKVPILTGFATHEGAPFVPSSMSTSDEFTQFFHTLIPALPQSDLDTLDLLYPDPAKDPSSPYLDTREIPVGPQFKRVEAAYAHSAYICPVRQTAHRASAGQEAPVFLFHWALNKTVKGGASHADYTEYETLSPSVRKISKTQDEIAGTLHAYFTSYIVSGDPNKVRARYPNRPIWEALQQGKSNKLMLFGDGNDERAGGRGLGVPAQLADDDWSQKECEFWWTRSILTES